MGASSGIGKELAILYAQAGCKIGITGRRAALLDELKNNFPGQTETAVFDVMGADNIIQVQQLIQKPDGCIEWLRDSGFTQRITAKRRTQRK